MDKTRTCFFTGHRRIAADRIDKIREKLEENIENFIIKYDIENFICGGALGFDTIAAYEVLKARKKYPHIKLHLYLPCYGQSKRWSDVNQYKYRMIMSYADEIVYVTKEKYTKTCMQERNMRMIQDSDFCIAYCVYQRSGSGVTLRNASEKCSVIINIADEI